MITIIINDDGTVRKPIIECGAKFADNINALMEMME